MVILVYVDDLILAIDDMNAINPTKKLLSSHFQMKDMGILRYFLSIKVDHCEEGIFLSNRMYVQNLLKEYEMTNCKHVRLHVDRLKTHHYCSRCFSTLWVIQKPRRKAYLPVFDKA